MKKNIIIIGIGKRTRDDMLPAILASNSFNVMGIYARSTRNINLMNKEYLVRKLEDLSNDDLKKTDWLYLSIPISNLESVFKFLKHLNTEKIRLLIDTPVFPIRYFFLKRYLSNYFKVFVSEDAITLPWIETLRDKVGGRFNKIVLNKSVYAYHGIALIKSLTTEYNFKKVDLRIVGNQEIIEIVTHKNVEVSIVEPRDYKTGSMIFQGPKGVISDEKGFSGLTMNPILENKLCRGLNIGGQIVTFSESESRVIGEVEPESTVTSLTLQLKRIGMIRMLQEIAQNDSRGWSVNRAVSDVRLYELVHHFGKYFNVGRVLNIFYRN